MNRLKDSTSPYLLQHADNPVDWWPWSDEAFAAARERDVPVLLSVGYSACHWCHVMAHESFEDPATAALMNEHLVSIKVDREERPDIDAVYMTATQAMTGRGGWPMTVLMTAAGEPFACGTYFPREHFQQLIRVIAQAWREDRDNVTGQARKISQALSERASATTDALRDAGQASLAGLQLDGLAADAGQRAGSAAAELAAVSAAAVDGLAGDYDAVRGGFGGAPKFPPSMVCEFLLRQHARTGSEPALRMASHTMEAMARGGMYDQLGGGFARYSVDAAWVVPHFEKMLYDNALLARVYAHLWRRTGEPLARRVAEQTCDWMIRELGTAEGGLASALDADSEGEEGKFYSWAPAELTAVLGPQDGEFAAETLGVTTAGTFEHGRSVLQLPADPADEARFARIQAALLAAREERVRPGRDDKIVAAWNGMAIAALAETGLLLGRQDLISAAEAAATLLASLHIREDAAAGVRLARTSRDGAAGPSAGLLEDYACVADGFLALAGVTGQGRWVELAGRLLDTALDRFGDGAGGFFDTADDGEALIFRPADVADNATPSGAFAVAGALLSYGALTGSARHREAAVAALAPLARIAEQYPRAGGAGLAVAEALLAGPVEVAIVGPPGDPATAELHVAAFRAAPPGTVIALGTPPGTKAAPGNEAPTDTSADTPSGTEAAPGSEAPLDADTGAPPGTGAGPGTRTATAGDDYLVPLLAGRGLVDGRAAAYVCRDFACLAPVTDPAELMVALSGRK